MGRRHIKRLIGGYNVERLMKKGEEEEGGNHIVERPPRPPHLHRLLQLPKRRKKRERRKKATFSASRLCTQENQPSKKRRGSKRAPKGVGHGERAAESVGKRSDC
jgi:hypothetical protein